MPTINIKTGKLISYPDFCPVCEKKGNLKRLLVGSADKETDKKLKDLKNRELHIPIHGACRSLRELKAALSTALTLGLTIVVFYHFFSEYDYSKDIYLLIIGMSSFFIARKAFPIPINVTFHDSYVSFDFKSEKYSLEFRRLNEKSLREV